MKNGSRFLENDDNFTQTSLDSRVHSRLSTGKLVWEIGNKEAFSFLILRVTGLESTHAYHFWRRKIIFDSLIGGKTFLPKWRFSPRHFSLRRFSPKIISPHFFPKFAQVRRFSPKDVSPRDISPHFPIFMLLPQKLEIHWVRLIFQLILKFLIFLRHQKSKIHHPMIRLKLH